MVDKSQHINIWKLGLFILHADFHWCISWEIQGDQKSTSGDNSSFLLNQLMFQQLQLVRQPTPEWM